MDASRPPPEDVLRSVFGYQQFRPGQKELVDAVLSGRDSIGVMPTGSGKSLTYQIPARLLGGTTLVVSPLIALMKDQVDALQRRGYRATFVNSSLSPEERRARALRVREGRFELLYAAPEGLETSVGSALGGVRLSLIAVDEAHCISHWGHDFRPAYRNLAGLKERFRGVPVLALTATATRRVSADIAEQLAMLQPFEYRGSFFRENLRLRAVKKGGAEQVGSRGAILRQVRGRPGERGIVYCATRKAVEGLADELRRHGVRALAYHAGLDSAVRERAQNAFRDDAVEVIVATIAFGMGIDKPDIRYVIHRDMPGSIEGYCQEIGRAGRDGKASDCILFYSWADVAAHDRFTERVEDPDVAGRQREQARGMYRFAESQGCRHALLVRHFGERIAPCGASCDRCSPQALAPEPASPARLARPPGGNARRAADAPRQAGGHAAGLPAALRAEDGALFERLRALRRRIADARGVPAYLVFHDSTLHAIAAARPSDDAELLAIPGLGPRKLAAFGAALLEVVRGRAVVARDTRSGL
jgi:ATP-dependent DNA helicase RecQ